MSSVGSGSLTVEVVMAVSVQSRARGKVLKDLLNWLNQFE